MRHHQSAPLVQKTIELANHPGEEFAAPPADAAPKLTVQQALDAYTGQSNFQVPDGVSVSLGLLTRPIGPDIGPSTRKGDAVINGIAYDIYQRLAYGFMRDFRPVPPGRRCRTGRASNGCSLMRTPASTSEESPRRPTGRAAPPPSQPLRRTFRDLLPGSADDQTR